LFVEFVVVVAPAVAVGELNGVVVVGVDVAVAVG